MIRREFLKFLVALPVVGGLMAKGEAQVPRECRSWVGDSITHPSDFWRELESSVQYAREGDVIYVNNVAWTLVMDRFFDNRDRDSFTPCIYLYGHEVIRVLFNKASDYPMFRIGPAPKRICNVKMSSGDKEY